jgi:uncharacterized protein (DUF2147 family)
MDPAEIALVLKPIALILLALPAAAADPLAGDWVTGDGKAHVRLALAADGKTETGSIVWLQSPNDDSGKPRVDDRNPDEAQRARAIMGLTIVTGLAPDGDDGWDDGRIYDPMSGKTYRCKATLAKDGKTLRFRGYIGISLLGRSETWTRVQPAPAQP